MSVVCKMFIQSKSESPSSCSYQLGAVCRGEENKHWAAATPSGSMKVPASDLLDEVWAARDATAPEVYVTVEPDAEGEWTMESCEFSYGGCAARRPTGPTSRPTAPTSSTMRSAMGWVTDTSLVLPLVDRRRSWCNRPSGSKAAGPGPGPPSSNPRPIASAAGSPVRRAGRADRIACGTTHRADRKSTRLNSSH